MSLCPPQTTRANYDLKGKSYLRLAINSCEKQKNSWIKKKAHSLVDAVKNRTALQKMTNSFGYDSEKPIQLKSSTFKRPKNTEYALVNTNKGLQNISNSEVLIAPEDTDERTISKERNQGSLDLGSWRNIRTQNFKRFLTKERTFMLRTPTAKEVSWNSPKSRIIVQKSRFPKLSKTAPSRKFHVPKGATRGATFNSFLITRGLKKRVNNRSPHAGVRLIGFGSKLSNLIQKKIDLYVQKQYKKLFERTDAAILRKNREF